LLIASVVFNLNQVDNKTIISILKRTTTLLYLHGANPFQARRYSNAALFVENLGQEFTNLPHQEIEYLSSTHPKTIQLIQDIQNTGTLERLEALIANTPPGVLAMLELKGLGPKKVSTLWKELGVETLAALLAACKNNQVSQLSGFGVKTQALIVESLAWQENHKNMFLYATALPYAQALEDALKYHFPDALISLVGNLRRQREVIEKVVLLIGTEQPEPIRTWLSVYPSIKQNKQLSGIFAWRGIFTENNLQVCILFCPVREFYKQLILQTGSRKHLALPGPNNQYLGEAVSKSPYSANSELEIYQQVGLPYFPPELREGMAELAWLQAGQPTLITMQSLQGILHNHTTYSDGQDTLEVMAQYCKDLGYTYIGVTDHSQAANYAGGLNLDEIRAQHQLIDTLNQKLAPFKIFKGIEVDILGDGSLDYSPNILASFDFTIASIHSNLTMDQKTATERLLQAIKNPFTTILGHPTGRVLLKRPGYSIDYQAIIEACAKYGVIIEINANPWRLDLDWRWIKTAIEKGVCVSINPDAHHRHEIQNVFYGVLMGRKGGLTATHTFNALSSMAVDKHFQQRKASALKIL
jgi:DNA polymerase (family 10)